MKTLLITGASSGFGRSLAEIALERGYQVALAVRDTGSIADLVAAFPERALPISFDLTVPDDAGRAVAETVARFGRLDVLINNAGYGLLAGVEETTDEQLARNLETNFTGPFRLIRAALPVMREQQGGHIVNLSAIAAYANHAGFAVYGGAKAALDAASDALAEEVRPFGIRITLVVPGPYRTDFIGRSLDLANRLPAYEATVGKFGAFLRKINGTQPGSPVKAAHAILDVIESAKPPFRLLLGGYAHTMFQKRLSVQGAEMEEWRGVGLPTDFVPGE